MERLSHEMVRLKLSIKDIQETQSQDISGSVSAEVLHQYREFDFTFNLNEFPLNLNLWKHVLKNRRNKKDKILILFN